MAATTCSVSGIENLLGRVGLDTPIPEFPGADIVHNPQDIFRVYLADTLEKLLHCDRMVAYDAIQTSNVTGMGDLVIVAPRLRLKDVKPEDLVKDLLQKLPRTPPFGCPLRDGIRLQVYFSPNTLPRLLLSYISDRSSSYGYDTSLGLTDPASPDGSKKKVIVEYSSPNMASEFQVSHLRSTLIGTYIANIYASMGWDVVKMNYLGDWGKQIGLLAAGWERFGSEDEFAKQPLRHLLEVNHKIQDLFKPEMEECKIAKAKGQDVTDIESRGLYAERDILFKKMEDKEPEAIAVWQRFRDATVRDYADSYAQLGATFDEYSGESQVTAESIAEVEQILKDKGIYEEHEDSWKIDFSKHDAKGLSLAVLRYRNGTTSYLLRDLAAVFDRYKKHKFDKMIYVVAMEQEMHFHRVTKTLELMGRHDLAERIQHLPFAKINGLPEELKEAALLSDYLDGCRSISHAGLDKDDEEASYVDKSENSVRQLSLAGLFIQDHYHKRTTSYAIDPKKMISLEGETGAAIQNCYARLLAQLGSEPAQFDYTTLDHTSLETADYSELLRILLQYPDAAHGSFKTLEPSFIVGYLLRLVDQLMLTLDDDDEKDWAGLEAANEARLALYENTRQVFENALRLLGVAPWSP
ncbi:Arginine--tRNA ligase [Fusarium oxysporum f. sp. cubense]|uniref:arginine--tRNA ligase n=1 Tax=Fusarium oxysporum f. sp. cubense TaxID=61366 RepID=A0A559LCF9_FUSOC|nr:Arginine--tRNA ligase [Fusarium oxysporum f. sp. cubense]